LFELLILLKTQGSLTSKSALLCHGLGHMLVEISLAPLKVFNLALKVCCHRVALRDGFVE